MPLVRAVSRSARRALVIADPPFGSYQGLRRATLPHCRTLHEGRWLLKSRKPYPFPPSVSAPAINAMRRCWSGRTWPGCEPGACHASSSDMPTCMALCIRQRRILWPMWKKVPSWTRSFFLRTSPKQRRAHATKRWSRPGQITGQLFHPLHPACEVAVRCEVHIAFGGQHDVGVDRAIGNRGPAQRQPVIALQMRVEQ